MLRIGQGDYTKIPTMRDFENPTGIELRDFQNFLKAYRARGGRPFTEWNQVTVSHKAADAIFGEVVDSSVFNELKHWAKGEQSYPILKDLSGAIQKIIRKSFENGLRKSLPPTLLRDTEMMKRFRVYLGASEPAAYAIVRPGESAQEQLYH